MSSSFQDVSTLNASSVRENEKENNNEVEEITREALGDGEAQVVPSRRRDGEALDANDETLETSEEVKIDTAFNEESIMAGDETQAGIETAGEQSSSYTTPVVTSPDKFKMDFQPFNTSPRSPSSPPTLDLRGVAEVDDDDVEGAGDLNAAGSTAATTTTTDAAATPSVTTTVSSPLPNVATPNDAKVPSPPAQTQTARPTSSPAPNSTARPISPRHPLHVLMTAIAHELEMLVESDEASSADATTTDNNQSEDVDGVKPVVNTINEEGEEDHNKKQPWVYPPPYLGVPPISIHVCDPDELWAFVEPHLLKRVRRAHNGGVRRSAFTVSASLPPPQAATFDRHQNSYVVMMLVRCESLRDYTNVTKQRVKALVEEVERREDKEWLLVLVETTLESRRVYAKMQTEFDPMRVCLASVFDYRSASATSPALPHYSSSSGISTPVSSSSFAANDASASDATNVSNLTKTLAPLSRWASSSSSSSNAAQISQGEVSGNPTTTGESSMNGSTLNPNLEVAPRPARDGLWGDLARRMVEAVDRAYRSRATRYKADVYAALSQRLHTPPGETWNFCNYLVLEENLAFASLQTDDWKHALRCYTESNEVLSSILGEDDAFALKLVRADNVDDIASLRDRLLFPPASPKSNTRSGETVITHAAFPARVLDPVRLNYREMIGTSTVSYLQLQSYLFARQSLLLLACARPSDALENALRWYFPAVRRRLLSPPRDEKGEIKPSSDSVRKNRERLAHAFFVAAALELVAAGHACAALFQIGGRERVRLCLLQALLLERASASLDRLSPPRSHALGGGRNSSDMKKEEDHDSVIHTLPSGFGKLLAAQAGETRAKLLEACGEHFIGAGRFRTAAGFRHRRAVLEEETASKDLGKREFLLMDSSRWWSGGAKASIPQQAALGGLGSPPSTPRIQSKSSLNTHDEWPELKAMSLLKLISDHSSSGNHARPFTPYDFDTICNLLPRLRLQDSALFLQLYRSVARSFSRDAKCNVLPFALEILEEDPAVLPSPERRGRRFRITCEDPDTAQAFSAKYRIETLLVDFVRIEEEFRFSTPTGATVNNNTNNNDAVVVSPSTSNLASYTAGGGDNGNANRQLIVPSSAERRERGGIVGMWRRRGGESNGGSSSGASNIICEARMEFVRLGREEEGGDRTSTPREDAEDLDELPPGDYRPRIAARITVADISSSTVRIGVIRVAKRRSPLGNAEMEVVETVPELPFPFVVRCTVPKTVFNGISGADTKGKFSARSSTTRPPSFEIGFELETEAEETTTSMQTRRQARRISRIPSWLSVSCFPSGIGRIRMVPENDDGASSTSSPAAESIAIDDFLISSDSNSRFKSIKFEFLPLATGNPGEGGKANAEIQINLLWKSREEETVPRSHTQRFPFTIDRAFTAKHDAVAMPLGETLLRIRIDRQQGEGALMLNSLAITDPRTGRLLTTPPPTLACVLPIVINAPIPAPSSASTTGEENFNVNGDGGRAKRVDLVFYLESANVVEKLKKRQGSGRTLVPLNARASVFLMENGKRVGGETEVSWDVPVLFTCRRRREPAATEPTPVNGTSDAFEVTAEIGTSWEEEEDEAGEEGGELRLTLGEEAV